MFMRRLLRLRMVVSGSICGPHLNAREGAPLVRFCSSQEEKPKQLVVHGSFEDIPNKNRDTYLDMIYIYLNREEVHRRNHVEFIYAALKNMESFGVNKDLEVYKSLIEVMPKGKFIPTNIFQVEFMHYPKQQQCVIDLLEQMEDNGVMPDFDMEQMLKNVFGDRGYPLRKYWRMMYWMPKFKNASPWLVPRDLPNDLLEQAKLAIEMITSVDTQTQISIYQTKDIEDSIDETWIVSGQSPTQKRLLHKHNATEPIYVEGPFRVWLRQNSVNYFIIRTKPIKQDFKEEDFDDVANIKVSFFNFKPPIKRHLVNVPSVHEQDDGTILAVCATGMSSKDSLLSWIRHLEKDGNPVLAHVPVIFTLKTGTKEVATVDNKNNEKITDS